MFKYFKWLALLVLVAPIFAKDAKVSQAKALVDYLQSQHVKIVMNGQSFSMFIPVDQVFVPGSTNMKSSTKFLRGLRTFVEQYNPNNVSIIARFDFDVTPREQDLVREQAILLMRGLDLKAPGRIVATGSEGIYKNAKLKFWQEVTTTNLIEVRWDSRLDVEYMVLDAGKDSK